MGCFGELHLVGCGNGRIFSRFAQGQYGIFIAYEEASREHPSKEAIAKCLKVVEKNCCFLFKNCYLSFLQTYIFKRLKTTYPQRVVLMSNVWVIVLTLLNLQYIYNAI